MCHSSQAQREAVGDIDDASLPKISAPKSPGGERGVVSHVLHTNLSHPRISSRCHIRQSLSPRFAVRPITNSLKVSPFLIQQKWRRGGCTTKNLGPDQVSPPSSPPCPAGRRRSYCKTLHLLMPGLSSPPPSPGRSLSPTAAGRCNPQRLGHTDKTALSRIHRPVTVG